MSTSEFSADLTIVLPEKSGRWTPKTLKDGLLIETKLDDVCRKSAGTASVNHPTQQRTSRSRTFHRLRQGGYAKSSFTYSIHKRQFAAYGLAYGPTVLQAKTSTQATMRHFEHAKRVVAAADDQLDCIYDPHCQPYCGRTSTVQSGQAAGAGARVKSGPVTGPKKDNHRTTEWPPVTSTRRAQLNSFRHHVKRQSRRKTVISLWHPHPRLTVLFDISVRLSSCRSQLTKTRSRTTPRRTNSTRMRSTTSCLHSNVCLPLLSTPLSQLNCT